jgi:hypothetical protein
MALSNGYQTPEKLILQNQLLCSHEPFRSCYPVTGSLMTIELPHELEAQLKQAAQALGVSVSQYVEGIVAETNLRRAQVSEFRAAIAERMESLNAANIADGEEVMARLIADLPSR